MNQFYFKNAIIAIFIILLAFFNANAQCPPGDVVLKSQAQVDQFLIDWPNCSQISGYLTIEGPDINNLTPLSNLTTVENYLRIYTNHSLSSLNGLNGITNINGSLDIGNNPLLTDLNGLNNLKRIGQDIQIRNSIFTNLDGLSSLTSVVGFIRINDNNELTNINGLSKLTNIGGYLNLSNNSVLTNINGLSNVTNIGGNLIINNNTQLKNLSFTRLSSISKSLIIEANPLVSDLNNFSNLTYVGDAVAILKNQILSDISGLSHINPWTMLGLGLFIENNPALAVCHLPNFCTYLASSRPRNITGNLANCINEQAVINACCILNPPQNITTTNANNCQANNGRVTFEISATCNTPVFYSLNGISWALTNNTTVTITNLFPRSYRLYIVKQGSNGLPDFNSLQFGFFTIGSNTSGNGSIHINCPADITLTHSTTNFTNFDLPQFYGFCGVTNTKISKLVVVRPDGTFTNNDPYDPSLAYGLTPRQEGTYQVKWTITGQSGNNTITKTCTQLITSKQKADAVFKSSICNVTPTKVASCGSGTTVAQIQVSGLKILNAYNGLKSVKINANFPGKFNGVINLISPNGTKFELTKGTEFPQFDGSKQNFIVNFTSCYGVVNPKVADNIPFFPNSTYRAHQSLETINYNDINPNGIWGLEVCASTNITWDLNCFELEFGELCPELLDFTVVGGCNTSGKGNVTVSLSQIKGAYCDDIELDGVLNYRMSIENIGDVTLQPNQQFLSLDAAPGTYTLRFGRYWRNSGVLGWHCYKNYIVTIPVTDNQKPQIAGCHANQTIQLGSNGTVDFTTYHPTAITDNCGIKSSGIIIRYLNGATNASGQILEYGRFTIGSSHKLTIRGTGKVEIEYWATDHANNTAICKFTVTTLDAPCVNDRIRPVFTTCPINQIAVLDNNDRVVISVTDPFFSDNCAVTVQKHEIFYQLGTHNDLGETYKSYNNIDQGKIYAYDINKEGIVLFKYTVEDAAGNTNYCYSYIRTVKNQNTCSNDLTPPVLSNCPSDITLSLDANGKATLNLKDPDVFDNCLISSMSLSINCTNGATVLNESTLYYPTFSPGSGFKYDFEGAGISNFVYTVADQNGNISSCSFKVTTVPQGQDALFNFGNICVSPGVPTYVPVTVNRFNKIGAFSFDAYFANTTGIKFIGIDNANITNVSSNILSNGTLRISWDEPGGNDITLADNFKLFDIVIESDINFINPTQLLGRDLAILSSGSSNGIINAADICVGFNAHPKGIIKSASNIAHSDVNVDLLSGLVQIGHTTTTADGSYSFTKTNYTNRVQPLKNDEWRKGVDILDVARIRRHFLQTDILNDNYKILAADVNKDGKINVLDVAYTNRLFLHKINEFPNNTSWRFIPEALGANFDPLNVNIPEFINLNDPNVDDTKLNFISVKTGDVDNNALLRNEHETSTRSVLALNISLPDTVVNAGTNIRIPVKVNGLDSISIMSMVINFDYTQLVLKDIESDKIPGFSNSNFNDLGDRVLIGWDHPQVKSISAEGVLLTLVFETKNMVGVSPLEMSDINMYTRDFNKINVIAQNGTLAYGTSSTESWTTTKFLKAYPNPFSGSIQILAALPQQEDYTLQVYDVNGKLIFTKFVDRINYKQPVLLDNFPNSGVYLVNLSSNSINENLKIVHMD